MSDGFWFFMLGMLFGGAYGMQIGIHAGRYLQQNSERRIRDAVSQSRKAQARVGSGRG